MTDSYVVSNVTVIPMTEDSKTLPGSAVVIEDGVITAIGPTASVKAPAGARVIDGTGKYLTPGLIDMHTHIVPHIVMPREGEDALETSLDMAGEYLGLFLHFGVTTIRNQAGSDFLLKVKKAAETGRYPSPRINMSGPIIESLFSWQGIATYAIKVETPEEARAEVHRQKNAGYDCLKIYNNTTAECFAAMVEEARKVGIRIGGHIPLPVGLIGAMEAGQECVEHLRGFDAVLDTRPFHLRKPDFAGDIYAGWRYATPEGIAELADTVAKYPDTWHVPTMVVEDPEVSDTVYTQELWAKVPYATRQHIEGLFINLTMTPHDRGLTRNGMAARKQMLLELDNRDVKIMTGSDCPGAKTRLIPGHSLLSEIEAFVSAGIRPWRALRAATATPAAYLNLSDTIGAVEVGKRADLVLMDADPLANIANIRRQSGVFADGRWFETGAKGPSDILSWTYEAGHTVAHVDDLDPHVQRGVSKSPWPSAPAPKLPGTAAV